MENRFRTGLMLFVLTLSLVKAEAQSNQSDFGIIPMPEKLERTNATFTITNKTRIVAQKGNTEAVRIATMLVSKFQQVAGYKINVEEGNKTTADKGTILFTTTDDASLGKEGYQLSVSNHGVILKAAEPGGLFYGLQTIYQLLPAEIEGSSPSPKIVWSL